MFCVLMKCVVEPRLGIRIFYQAQAYRNMNEVAGT